MSIMVYGLAVLSALSSVFCFGTGSLSAVASFVFSAAFTALFAVTSFRFMRSPSWKTLSSYRKTLEYLPFALFAAFIARRSGGPETPFSLDLASALAWTACALGSFALQYLLADKRVARRFPSIAIPQGSGRKPPVKHALEWLDALVQAACLVLLINLFLFQLYAIPTESMVPEFMVGDRVVVLKTPSGPTFPLTEVGIPRTREYSRGDIVVFNNPRYNDTREDRVRSFVSQLVYMLTFTSVNINRDEAGNIKADPLVKRIVGEPGEKLMMVDGVLYAKRADSPSSEGDNPSLSGWKPVAEDATWAAWDLASLPRSELSLVKSVPLTRQEYAYMGSLESVRANLNLDDAADECRGIVRSFASLKGTAETVVRAPDLVPQSRREMYALIESSDEITRLLLTTNGGLLWFGDFMTEWADAPARGDLYQDRGMRLNVMAKLAVGRLILRNAELLSSNVTAEEYYRDESRMTLKSEADSLRFYLAINDQRNMPVFPAKEGEYIPEDSFLMMGDDRLNSLDMRHSYSFKLTPVDRGDPLSVLYVSNMEPRAVHVSRILGSASFRFWPPTRIGIPR